MGSPPQKSSFKKAQQRKRFPWILGVIVSIGFLAILAFVIVTLLILQSQGISRGINILTVISIVGSFMIGVFGLLLSFLQLHHARPSNHPESVQQALHGINIKPIVSSPTSTSKATMNQEDSLSKTVWNVPFRRNHFFTGREELLKQLRSNLTNRKATALTQAISGLGGIGKTQTAVEYAFRYRGKYHAVLWVMAATRGTLITSFLDLARLLELPEKDDQDQKIAVQAVKQWLEQHDQWLLIFDNADDLTLVEEFLPTGGNGHILLTTRAQAPGLLANGINVEEMERDEGMLFLLHRAKVLAIEAPLSQASKADSVAAETIVKEMGGLPLALDQAGAYIEETQCGLSAYLVIYRQRQVELLRRRGGTGKDHPEPVATTWSLSFEQIEQRNAIAADLLRICAFLAPDAIPEELLVLGAPELGIGLQPLATDPTLFNDAISTLLGYSLVKRNAQECTISIHRLVQRVLIDAMPEETQRLWAKRTLLALNRVFPSGDYQTWSLCQRLLPHVQASTSLIEYYKLASPEIATLLHRVGEYLRKSGQYRQAESLLQQALSMREHLLGPEHLETSHTLDSLAWIYQNQGRYVEAEPLILRALRIHEQTLGPDHPDTAIILHNLAWLYRLQGRFAEAQRLLQRAVHILEQTPDPHHPEMTTTLHNPAQVYEPQGRFAKAEPFYRPIVYTKEQKLGPDHPETAITLDALAQVYEAQGRYTEAEPLYQRALRIKEQKLGPDHPETAITLANLATLYKNQNRFAEAEPLYQRASRIFEQTWGPDHPELATTLYNLAELYCAQGEYERAKPLLQCALLIREKQLGPDHPDTARIRKSYSTLIRNTKRQRKE